MIANYHEEVGARLRKCREDSGYNVKQVSDVLGISVSQYRKIERGEYALSDEKIVIIYDYLGIDPLYLLTGKTVSTDPTSTRTTKTLSVMQDFFSYITEISAEE